MKQEDSRSEARIFVGKLQETLRTVFDKHRRSVDRLNDEKKFGGPMNKNDKSEKIYAELAEVAKELKNVERRIHECEKLRRERRELFERKAAAFSEAVGSLVRNKNIRIKINEHVEKLAARSMDATQEVLKALRSYEKESSALCGKAYDHKPAVQRAFLQLSELGFLWESMGKLDSVTNDSVKELYLPADYRAADFQQLENEVVKMWPEPKEVVRVVSEKVQEIVEFKSELQLAHELLFGFTRPQEIARALEIYQKEASKANPDPSALNSLGTLYEEGRGVAPDKAKAFKYFMTAAKMGDAEGLYKVGKYLEKGLLNSKQLFDGLYSNREAEIRGGIEYYEKAAAKGHLDALTDLGFIYEKGIILDDQTDFIIEPHPQHARKYYEKAKEKQFPRAYNNLGNLLITTTPTSSPTTSQVTPTLNQNALLQKGIKYLEKAVQMKYPKAAINLGKCYMTGTGVSLNLEKARALFRQAADLGEIQGRLEYMRSYIGTNLEQEQTMTELVETARTVLLSNNRNPEALYLMGLLEERGIGVPANKEASFHYIASAARLDYAPALTRLGDYYYSGHFVDKNYDNARILYEKAAEKGDSQALLNLALMQDKGLLPHGSTLGEAEQLYQRAEQMGNTNAMLIRGLKTDAPSHHHEKVVKAAEQGNLRALKILNSTGGHMQPIWKGSGGEQEMRKVGTFYMRQSNPGRGGFKL